MSIFHIFTSINVGVFSFVTTNLDDLLLLIILFSSQRYSVRKIVIGQYLGITSLILISWVSGALTVSLLPTHLIPFLGIIPILVGAYKLYDLKIKKTHFDSESQHRDNTFEVGMISAITISNGTDNIAVYTSLFSSSTLVENIIFIALFLVLIGLWCKLGLFLASRNKLAALFQKRIPALFPFLMIGLGAIILLRSHLI